MGFNIFGGLLDLMGERGKDIKQGVEDLSNFNDKIQGAVEASRNQKNNPREVKAKKSYENNPEAYEGFVQKGHPYVKFEVVKSTGEDSKNFKNNVSNSTTPDAVNGILKYVKVPINPEFLKTGYSFSYDIEDKLASATDFARKQVKEAADSTIGKAISQKMGKTVNPNIENMFKTVDFRKLDFTFELIPKNSNQDEQIEQIIKMFKYWSHPEIDLAGTAFNYPDQWVIHYNSGVNNGSQGVTFKTKKCNCESITIEYGNSGGYTLFKTSHKPTSVRFNLSFTESDYITRQDIREGY